MVRKVERFEAKDGTQFENGIDAQIHEAECAFKDLIDKYTDEGGELSTHNLVRGIVDNAHPPTNSCFH